MHQRAQQQGSVSLYYLDIHLTNYRFPNKNHFIQGPKDLVDPPNLTSMPMFLDETVGEEGFETEREESSLESVLVVLSDLVLLLALDP